MTRELGGRLAALLLLALMVLVPGCERPPPSEQDLLQYVRSAQVNAPVRRLWDGGQSYVDRVLRAYAQVRTHDRPLLALRQAESLPALDDAAWRDAAELKSMRTRVDSVRSESAVQQRREALSALAQAVDALPPEIPASQQAELKDAIWTALQIEGQDLRGLHESSLALAESWAALLDEAERSTPPAITEAFRERHDALRRELDALAAQRRAWLEQTVQNAQEQIDQLSELREALRRGERPPGHDDRWAWRRLEDRIDYQLARRAHRGKLLKDLEKAD